MASFITSSNLQGAVALDAADGALDGRYFGTQIGIDQNSGFTASSYGAPVGATLPPSLSPFPAFQLLSSGPIYGAAPPAPAFMQSAPQYVAAPSAPTFVQAAPQYVQPTQIYAPSAPTLMQAAPQYVGPAPVYAAPTFVQAAPQYAPAYAPSAPTFVQAAPQYAPAYAPSAPTFVQAAPQYVAPAPSYVATPMYAAAPSYAAPASYVAPSYVAPGYAAPTYLSATPTYVAAPAPAYVPPPSYQGYPVVAPLANPTPFSSIPCYSLVSAAPTVTAPIMMAPPTQVVWCTAAPQPEVRYVESPPEIRYIPSPPEIRYIEAPTPEVPPPPPRDMELAARLAALEAEFMQLRMRMEAKQETKVSTKMQETYKVKTFEQAAKLAVMDGTDDGLYNGLPIEVEGEGLYRDLVRMGRRVRADASLTGQTTSSVTRSSETYKVASFELAEKLTKMSGSHDGTYNGLPIEIAGEGLYSELLRAGRRHR